MNHDLPSLMRPWPCACLPHATFAGVQQQVAAGRDPVPAAARGDARSHAIRCARCCAPCPCTTAVGAWHVGAWLCCPCWVLTTCTTLMHPGAGDLSRMLPFEAHLLAAGWPRWEDAPSGSNGGEGREDEEGRDGSGGERVLAREGSRAARMLFMARRCEAAEGLWVTCRLLRLGLHVVVRTCRHGIGWHGMTWHSGARLVMARHGHGMA